MLESLTLRNFQTHVKRTIHFDQRVTTIIGATDAGKSAILRALRWVCLNQFPGPADSFIHWNAAFSKVVLRVDGHVLTRKKGQTNAFSLDEQEYRAFGMGKVPEPVADLLQLSTVNFQSQFDGHFWLSDSAGQISRELNQIINLEVIDESLASVAAVARKTGIEIEVLSKQVDASRERVKNLAWLTNAETSLSWLEAAADRQIQRKRRSDDLRSILSQACDSTDCVRRTREIVGLAARIEGLGAAVITIGTKTKRLRSLIADLNRTHQISLIRVPDCQADPDNVKRATDRRTRLENLIQQLERMERTSCEKRTEASETKARLEREIGERCPLCGNPRSSPSSALTSICRSDHP